MDSAPAVISPCDVAAFPPGWRVRVGGRIMDVRGREVVIADATTSITAHLAEGSNIPVAGTLCVVEGVAEGMRLSEAVAVEEYPGSGGEIAREHDRLWRRGVGRGLVQRDLGIRAVREWFFARDFVEVDTPLRVRSPGLDLHLDAFESEGKFLITSPEYQMKRLLSGGMPRIFQISHCFRRGEEGPWHDPEFLMLEWYRAFSGIDAVMGDTEQIVQQVVTRLRGVPELEVGARKVSVRPPFERMTVCEAFARFAGIGEAEVIRSAHETPDDYFRILVETVEPAIASMDHPVFVTDYPAEQASLARLRPGDPRFCERFELYVAGIELCNGFGELTDPKEQRLRLERDRFERREAGKPEYPVDERFLRALEDGMPPSGGNAMGLDRLLTLAVGGTGIADVLPCPASWA